MMGIRMTWIWWLLYNGPFDNFHKMDIIMSCFVYLAHEGHSSDLLSFVYPESLFEII